MMAEDQFVVVHMIAIGVEIIECVGEEVDREYEWSNVLLPIFLLLHYADGF